MGVVNVTPDSFYDGGRHFDLERAVDRTVEMVEEGADIIDIGGESTRPYSSGIGEAEEKDRVLPVIEALAGKIAPPISIDTKKSGVARAALAAGAEVINDISGMRADPEMIPLAAETGAGAVLMHIRGAPEEMQLLTDYADLIGEIKNELASAAQACLEGGVDPVRIVLDPGIGFAKKAEQNLEIIRRLDEFDELGYPLMIGPSRKSFIGAALKHRSLDDAPDERLMASVAATSLAAFKGAHILRVHDVAATRQSLAVADAVRDGRFSQ
jgi:dihydropteroate synthase